MSFVLEQEKAADAVAIDALLDQAFGAARFERTAYRFRDDVQPVEGLGFIARGQNGLLGSVRFWPLHINVEDTVTAGLLLGPLVVSSAVQGTGVGTALMRKGLAVATDRALGPVFLVGDAVYYGRVGFQPVMPSLCIMPGPVPPERLLFHPAGSGWKTLPERFSLCPVSVLTHVPSST
ncbi:N-acetyltransferase [Iodidimonas gelatinilytica]|uniref:N-acetyltransferase n=1 Tax=Iodidimonas gelatinilytica TaxID=1236966 RepID=A0A5A7MVY3_9PROT|nr:N-acetyltransferase [Iodidimonas gelatinilytica]GEQ97213.1 N-acetyltransferase [Iodidimonas gelatinilytica]GEQ99543.1 N-acetyltransferase [Iodidimonas gelatinilytica]